MAVDCSSSSSSRGAVLPKDRSTLTPVRHTKKRRSCSSAVSKQSEWFFWTTADQNTEGRGRSNWMKKERSRGHAAASDCYY